MENLITKEIIQNLKTMVAEFSLPVKHYQAVIAPISNLLKHLEEEEWIVTHAKQPDNKSEDKG
jgi:hypothetical protein